jgi:hypothetical protein
MRYEFWYWKFGPAGGIQVRYSVTHVNAMAGGRLERKNAFVFVRFPHAAERGMLFLRCFDAAI